MPSRERGTALIAVTWMLLLLAVLVAGALAAARSELHTVERLVERARANAAADGAIVELIAELGRRDELLKPNAGPRELTIGDFQVSVSVEDEAGKVDLNRASEELLTQTLAIWIPAMDDAERLAARIVDWRDADNVKSPKGAEALDYRAAQLPYSPRNGLFPTITELKQVFGMTPELFECIEPVVTVYSGLSGVDPRVAAPASRAALEPPIQAQDDGGDPVIIDPVGRVFLLRASAARDKLKIIREAVIRMTGDPQRPAMVMSWQQSWRSVPRCSVTSPPHQERQERRALSDERL